MTDRRDVTPIPKPAPREKKPSTWGRRRKRVKPMSDNKRAEVDTHAPIREEVFYRDGRRCRLAPFFPDVECFGPLTVHHIVKEGQGGGYTLENLVSACARHNDLVEERPAEAKALGLTQSAPPLPGPLYRRPPGGES